METNVKLMVVLNKLSYTFLNRLATDLEEHGMSRSIYPMLAHLYQVGRAKTQKLGEVAVITSGTITHNISKMVKLGYVRKVQDEEDLRVFWVQITDEGRQAFRRVHEEHMKYLDSLLSDISEDDKLTFIDQIKYFGKTIEKKES